ncbi:alpha-2-macroglobulin family protein, partial [Wenyingzhuangia sp. 1_MG-2023]|nr:alpha-2-macroglobulin family protein [Wenyingzhuangia sp. 1_MG-2023]
VGVLSISRFDTPDPFSFFFEPRRYSVDMFDIYSQVIDFNNSQPATLNFGGDAAMARGGDMARSQVQIVSLFSGKVDVVNGVANIPLQLPDFNGRLRLMAVAFTDDAFGHMEQEVTVAAPIVTQLSMPRFAGMDDDAHIALDVTNLSGQPQTLTVT